MSTAADWDALVERQRPLEERRWVVLRALFRLRDRLGVRRLRTRTVELVDAWPYLGRPRVRHLGIRYGLEEG